MSPDLPPELVHLIEKRRLADRRKPETSADPTGAAQIAKNTPSAHSGARQPSLDRRRRQRRQTPKRGKH